MAEVIDDDPNVIYKAEYPNVFFSVRKLLLQHLRSVPEEFRHEVAANFSINIARDIPEHMFGIWEGTCKFDPLNVDDIEVNEPLRRLQKNG